MIIKINSLGKGVDKDYPSLILDTKIGQNVPLDPQQQLSTQRANMWQTLNPGGVPIYWLIVTVLGIGMAGGSLSSFAATPISFPDISLQLYSGDGSEPAMEFVAYGYHLKDNPNRLCVSCHGREGKKMNLSQIHRRHVEKECLDCSDCHNFTRATAPTRRKP